MQHYRGRASPSPSPKLERETSEDDCRWAKVKNFYSAAA